MLFRRRDRVELAVLGLTVLTWALLLAPVVHTLEHGHGHRHAHGAPSSPSGTHGAGSVEHLLAVTSELVLPEAPVAVWTRVELERPASPDVVVLAARHRAEQPQGP